MSSASSRSSETAFGRDLRRATRIVAEATSALPPGSAILIDGRSGAGKSTLATDLRERIRPQRTCALVRLDWLYPGWDGLDVGVRTARNGILRPHAAGRPGRWTAWDWAADAPGATHTVEADDLLIVEGSGILTPETAELAGVRVWMDAPEHSRRARALTRDGETYRPHWERWARQEQRHIERDRPLDWATHSFALP